jgi:hypothetical protein
VVRDEQVRRYARHILLPDVGGLGQTALLIASARVAVTREPEADLIAARYLAAGGVGTLVVTGATADELAQLAQAGADSHVLAHGEGAEVVVDGAPAWWPAAEGDAIARAYWRGGHAATCWMAERANK